MSILVPVFLPKYKHRDAKEPRGRAGAVVAVNRNAHNVRSSISQLQAESNESAEIQSSSEEAGESGSAGRRKSGNVASFFASRPQAVLRNSDSLGMSSLHTRGSGPRGSNRGSHISGLHFNLGNRDTPNFRASTGAALAKRNKSPQRQRRTSDFMNNDISNKGSPARRRATYSQGSTSEKFGNTGSGS
jgi:hypothetical protein